MGEIFVNNPSTTLSASCTSSATTISVTSGTGYPGTGDFRIKVDNEFMLVTGVSGTTWTVTRGIESTTRASHSSGATVDAILTAGALATLQGGSSYPYTANTLPDDSLFSWTNQGSGPGASRTVNSDGSIYLMAPADASNSNLRIRRATLLFSPPYTVEVGFFPLVNTVNYAECGWGLLDSASGKIVLNSLHTDGGSLLIEGAGYYSSATSYSGLGVTLDPVPRIASGQRAYRKVVNDGTNKYFYWSPNGQNWILMGSDGATNYLTPDSFFFFADSNGSSRETGIALFHHKETTP